MKEEAESLTTIKATEQKRINEPAWVQNKKYRATFLALLLGLDIRTK